MSKLKHLATSYNPVQANIIKGILETNDIPCILFDEDSFSAMSILSLAIGGIRIMVHQDDLKTAKKLLKDMDEDNLKHEL